MIKKIGGWRAGPEKRGCSPFLFQALLVICSLFWLSLPTKSLEQTTEVLFRHLVLGTLEYATFDIPIFYHGSEALRTDFCNWHCFLCIQVSWELRNKRNSTSQSHVRACSHGGGGPQVGEVPRLGGVTNLSIQSLFFAWLLSHERWGTSPRRVAWSAVPGNPLRWGDV